MSVEHYTRREMMLDLREKLLRSEAERIAGCRSYSVDEVSTRLKELIDE